MLESVNGISFFKDFSMVKNETLRLTISLKKFFFTKKSSSKIPA
ncbi:MAG: hypothetical protein Ct9H90mP15_00050 [Candidatus Neomarinimicrobiota bacterium]|nr:MAG: hypothetical protein Ct9H90mP15_00050 [Candidatus Neomarinimicrobiota bacterium]